MANYRTQSYSYDYGSPEWSSKVNTTPDESSFTFAPSSFAKNQSRGFTKNIAKLNDISTKSGYGLESLNHSGLNPILSARGNDDIYNTGKFGGLNYPGTPNASSSFSIASTKFNSEIASPNSFFSKSSIDLMTISSFITQVGAKDLINTTSVSAIQSTYTHAKQLSTQNEAILNALCFKFSEQLAAMEPYDAFSSRIRTIFSSEEWFYSKTYLFSLALKGTPASPSTPSNLTKSQRFYESFASDSNLNQKGVAAFKEVVDKFSKDLAFKDQLQLRSSYSWMNEVDKQHREVFLKVAQLLQMRLKVYIMTNVEIREESFLPSTSLTDLGISTSYDEFAVFYHRSKDQVYLLSSNTDGQSPSLFGSDSYLLETSFRKSVQTPVPASATARLSPQKFSFPNQNTSIARSPSDPNNYPVEDNILNKHRATLMEVKNDISSYLNDSLNTSADHAPRRYSLQPENSLDLKTIQQGHNSIEPSRFGKRNTTAFIDSSNLSKASSTSAKEDALIVPNLSKELKSKFAPEITGFERAIQPKGKVDSPAHAHSATNSPLNSGRAHQPVNGTLKTILQKNYSDFFDSKSGNKQFYSPQVQSLSETENKTSVKSQISSLLKAGREPGSKLSNFYKDVKLEMPETIKLKLDQVNNKLKYDEHDFNSSVKSHIQIISTGIKTNVKLWEVDSLFSKYNPTYNRPKERTAY